jgi:tetratricopeptide (TPR) repeat protein
VDAAVEGGEGAAHVGAYERAIDLLRAGVDGARGLGDDDRLAVALGALGRVLVHGVRGSDEEAVAVLHEALVAARRSGSADVAARAALELGHVETLRGRYPRAGVWFGRARDLGGRDARLRAWVGVFDGIGRSDQADYAGAAAVLGAAAEDARSAADLRAEAYALTALGRLRVLRDEPGPALAVLDRACAVARDLGWTSFLPFPRSQRAEVLLRAGDLAGADAGFEGAYALACQVGDPCWEGYALRGRGLLAAARGDDDAALDLLTAAPGACRRQRDAHDWVEAHCLDALCGFAVPRGLPGAAGWVDDLEAFAARRGMRELVARAALHRAGLGQPGAAEHAAALVAGIDNPSLAAAAAAGA